MSQPTNPPTPNGVPDWAWERIAKPDGARWAIQERDALGEVIGTAYRDADGGKSFAPGGKRGLIVDWPLPTYAGTSADSPIFVCEGASDTGAMLGLPVDAVGVPMAGQCADMLAELLAGRHVVIVADADDAGRRGSMKIAGALAARCLAVRIIQPPDGAKDARAAVIAGANLHTFTELAKAAPEWQALPDSLRTLREGGGRKAFRAVSIVDLPPAEEPDWVWPGYLARGAITLFTGLWKAGKTTMIGHLLRDLYRGAGLVQSRIDAPTLVLSEESRNIWANRRDLLALPAPVHLVLRNGFTRPTKDEWQRQCAELVAMAAEHDAAIVVIDTLPSFWPVIQENDAAEVIDALSPLRELTENGVAVLLCHHPRKGDGSQATASRGSGALPGFVDTIVELRRFEPESKTDSRRVLSAYGRFEDTLPEAVFDLTDVGYVCVGDSARVGKADFDGVIGGLLTTGEGLTWEQMRERWPDTPKPGQTRLREALNAGAERGLWTRAGSGKKGHPFRYSTSPSAENALRSPASPTERNESKPNADGWGTV